MKEQIANWLETHEKAVVLTSTVAATAMLLGIGACIGANYRTYSINKMLGMDYTLGLLKAFNATGEEITAKGLGYFFK